MILQQVLKRSDAMNKSGLWKTWTTLGREHRALKNHMNDSKS